MVHLSEYFLTKTLITALSILVFSKDIQAEYDQYCIGLGLYHEFLPGHV